MMVLEREKIEVIVCCKKYVFCFIFYVILLVLDNMVFYEIFYRILNRKFEIFLLDLEL